MELLGQRQGVGWNPRWGWSATLRLIDAPWALT